MSWTKEDKVKFFDAREEIKGILHELPFTSPWEVEKFVSKIAKGVADEMRPAYEERSRIKYEEAKRKREALKEKQRVQGELFKTTVKPGMVVKCRGTKDGRGIREVLEVDALGITARKINRGWISRQNGRSERHLYFRDSYITTHGWDKISGILEIKIEE